MGTYGKIENLRWGINRLKQTQKENRQTPKSCKLPSGTFRKTLNKYSNKSITAKSGLSIISNSHNKGSHINKCNSKCEVTYEPGLKQDRTNSYNCTVSTKRSSM